MIMLTDRAKERLKALVLTRLRERRGGQSFRLAPGSPGQFGLVSDVPRPDDRQVEHDGTVVLLLSAPLASQLSGWTLDCLEDGEGDDVRLRLRPGQRGFVYAGVSRAPRHGGASSERPPTDT